MRIGVVADPWAGTLEDLVDEVRFTVEASLETYWMAQVWRFDAMTLIPHLAQLAPTLEFGTSVVASYLRHPMTLASQAMTTSLLTGGRFTLGVGLMHRPAIEGMFEIPFDHPVRHMGEYLDVLLPLLHHQQVDVSGVTVSYHGGLDVPNALTCPVMLGALGPRMLRLCGSRTSGTITWMTGPNTLREHIVPLVTDAAASAGRPPPRIVALVALRVTDDVKRGREQAAAALGGYGNLPSYRAMLDREGLARAEDFAIIGSEDSAREQIDAYEKSGITDIGLMIAGGIEDRDRSRAFIASLRD
jgi:5,10-methylenetetrahydromethanopterin reductase